MQMEDRQAAEGRTQSSVDGQYGNKDFLQLSQGASISMQMRSMVSKQFSATLKTRMSKLSHSLAYWALRTRSGSFWLREISILYG